MLIYTYNNDSQGARQLSLTLRARRIKHNSHTFIGRSFKRVINWGTSELCNEVKKCRIINNTSSVVKAGDKVIFFQTVQETTRIPRWTVDREVAQTWMEDTEAKRTYPVVCRTLTRASAGRGIVIAEEVSELVNAPLYTEYVPKKDEYRVHIVDDQVIDYSRKARSNHIPDEEVDWRVRTHDNGFIYMREGIEIPDDCLVQALAAMKAVSLDFGAVDVIWNEKRGKAYVLEINTAPGLEGTTLERYVSAFIELDNKMRYHNYKVKGER